MAFSALGPRVRLALERLGATQPGTLRRLARGGEDLGTILAELGEVVDIVDWTDAEKDQFSKLVETAGIPAERRLRQLADMDTMYMAHAAELRKKRARNESFEDSFRGLAVFRGEAAPRLNTAPVSTPTTTTSTTRSGAIDVDALRDRCIQELRDALVAMRAPVMAQLEDGGRLDVSFLAAGRRARTLRTRLRAWRSFASWLRLSYGEGWTSSWNRVAEFMEVRASEPCSRAVIRHLYHGVRFMQEAGGYEGEEAVTNHKLLRRYLKEVETRLGARAGGGVSKQAPRPLTSQVEALEALVVNEQLAPWIRAYGWWQSLKCWATLRHDDHAGLNPSSLRLDNIALSFTLDKTKTTGQDKKVNKRYGVVHREAYVMEPRWLQVGLEVWRGLAPAERSYLLETPTPTLDSCTHRQLRYHEAAAWSRNILVISGAMGEGEVSRVAASYYSEHSARSFLPSAGLVVGYTDEEMKPLGGWSASNTRSYIRTATEKVLEIQCRVAEELRRARAAGRDPLGDEREAGLLMNYLIDRGIDSERAASHVASMVTGSRRIEPSALNLSLPLSYEADSALAAPVGAPVEVPSEKTDGAQSDKVPPGEQGYCVSITKKTHHRRLHYVGRCHRVPGIDYADFEWWGQELPGPSFYDAVCKQCWKTAMPTGAAGSSGDRTPGTKQQDPELTEEDDGSTDESSSSADS